MIRRTLAPLTALIMLYAVPVSAQVSCGNRAAMVERLVNQYHEMPMGRGLGRARSRLLEIWANCTTGSWTVLKTYPNGTTCVMAVGEGWQGVGCERGKPV